MHTETNADTNAALPDVRPTFRDMTASGVLAAPAAVTTALLSQWLLRVSWQSAPFLPYSVGDLVIRRTPGSFTTDVIERFGAQGSDLLAASIIALILLLAVLGTWRTPAAAWSVAPVLAALTILGASLDPVPVPIAPTLLSAALAGSAALLACGVLRSRRPSTASSPFSPDRRRLLSAAGATALLGTLTTTAIVARIGGNPSRRLITASSPGRLEPDGAFPSVPGLSPRITSPEDHYVVDIDLNRPAVDGGSWRLTIAGEVAAPRALSFDNIRSLPSEEEPLLMHCVSNPVGGRLISNAIWVTTPLSGILDLVRPGASARFIKVEAADDYDEVIPLAEADQVRVAYAMGGSELAPAHGYPVRIIFPGRYGMRSVKWVTGLTLLAATRESYWGRRGWNDAAVMRTGSRIETPHDNSRVERELVIAGQAWAGVRGVAAVQVSFDGQRTWVDAQLEAAASRLSWRRWRLAAALPPGMTTVVVRAVDGEGNVQEAEERFPHPSGASGYHRITVHAK